MYIYIYRYIINGIESHSAEILIVHYLDARHIIACVQKEEGTLGNSQF
jgi:hypothetical protein